MPCTDYECMQRHGGSWIGRPVIADPGVHADSFADEFAAIVRGQCLSSEVGTAVNERLVCVLHDPDTSLFSVYDSLKHSYDADSYVPRGERKHPTGGKHIGFVAPQMARLSSRLSRMHMTNAS